MKKSDAKPVPKKKKSAGSSGIPDLMVTGSTPTGSLAESLNAGDNSQDESTDSHLTLFAASTNGSSVDLLDDVDSHDGQQATDTQRAKAAISHLQSKIARTMEAIKQEQRAKEDNVNEYLKLSSSADKQQMQRIKTVFEKKNQKSTQTIAQLQKKLDKYKRTLKEVEMHGVSGGHKQAKEVLRDMGQGLKSLWGIQPQSQPRDVTANIRDGITAVSGGVVDNIKGAKDTIVSKSKEFPSLIKNKFGSVDNITGMKTAEESQGSTDEGEKSNHQGSNTLPSNFRYPSDDEGSDITSGSVPSATHSSSRPPSQSQMNLPQVPPMDFGPVFRDLGENLRHQIREELDNFRTQVQNDYAMYKQSLEEERYRSERLEEQINDLTELHQHEVTNIKQELSSMEEKLEYQLEERTRDMQDLLESCQTRITKMELQQQQQHLISMDRFENSNFRALITKLINVVLALLAVILVLVSTLANLLAPFLTTRLRILTTICLIASIVAVIQNWTLVKECGQYISDRYRQLLPFH